MRPVRPRSNFCKEEIMENLFYILAAFATLLSLYNLISIRKLRKQIADTKDSIHGTVSWAKEDLRNDMNGIRSVLKVLAANGRITADMIEDGKPFSDISAADAEKILSGENRAVVIDVRTPSEYQAGHIEGSRLIPVDEIEERSAEVPRDADPILVVCQGGGRSAAACEILSSKGFVNLVNIYDGMGAWPGKREIGVSIRPPVKRDA
jgi:rhodanese-related sulfurtransferase